MKLNQIITSLLETDMYKFSMGQVIFNRFPSYKTTWTFKCRNNDVTFTNEMVEEIREQIKAYCNLRFSEDELDYLGSIQWIKEFYINHLRLWRPRFEDFTISGVDEGCGLVLEATGNWSDTSMYEIPVLAIVNEVYFRMNYDYDELFISFKSRLHEKLQLLSDGYYNLGTFSEFGLRRRLSGDAQDYLISKLSGSIGFIGTSNVYLAKKYNIKPVGTMAHEYIMCVGQGNPKHNPAYSNWYAMNEWIQEYGILNGIALTDTITTDCFLRDFQLTFASLFSGVRHDSGDPFEWGEKMINHYKSLCIDPKTKVLLFSDSNTFSTATDIYERFRGRIGVAFGIGTYLSNDTDAPALNIVMKVTSCNGRDVAKISDTSGKGMCKNPEYVAYLQRCIDWRMAMQEG